MVRQFMITAVFFLTLITAWPSLSLAAAPSRLVIGYASTTPRLMPLWVARDQGFELSEGATGGASDGNFTAALGVPTLDGLGATGDGPHAIHEHVIIKDLPVRSALVAGLLARLS